jgi:hypothetical protein
MEVQGIALVRLAQVVAQGAMMKRPRFMRPRSIGPRLIGPIGSWVPYTMSTFEMIDLSLFHAFLQGLIEHV